MVSLFLRGFSCILVANYFLGTFVESSTRFPLLSRFLHGLVQCLGLLDACFLGLEPVGKFFLTDLLEGACIWVQLAHNT